MCFHQCPEYMEYKGSEGCGPHPLGKNMVLVFRKQGEAIQKDGR